MKIIKNSGKLFAKFCKKSAKLSAIVNEKFEIRLFPRLQSELCQDHNVAELSRVVAIFQKEYVFPEQL